MTFRRAAEKGEHGMTVEVYEAEPAEVTAAVEEIVEEIAAAWPGAPLPRYAALSSAAAFHQAVLERLAGARAAVVAQMNADGMSYADIAEMTGLTRARVQQLAAKGRAIAVTGELDLLVRPRRPARPSGPPTQRRDARRDGLFGSTAG